MDDPESKGEEVLVYYSPLGALKLVANSDGICAVKWLSGKHECEGGVSSSGGGSPVTGSSDNRRQNVTLAENTSAAAIHLKACTTWLDAYFDGSLLKDNPPRPPLVFPTKASEGIGYCILSTSAGSNMYALNSPRFHLCALCFSLFHAGTFFHSVWCTLASTGVGERLSYKELARLAGHPGAARAVGQAMRRHCLPILVPCHRVVKSGSGKVGNYSGGDGKATKEWLLEHERKMTTP